ncbi:MAG: primosomal protein N' [Candidatus Omnitrophica bacterium]|nr:primosomal protein N' [Candidatus Omnitrophota bacterium]
MSDKNYVQVAVNLPLKDVFDYSVPRALAHKIALGKRVWAPFRNNTIIGYIVGIAEESSISGVKDIKDVIDEEALLSKDMLELTRWMGQYYFCSWGEAIEAAVSGPFKKGKTTINLRKNTELLPGINLEGKISEKILSAHQDKALLEVNAFIKKQEHAVFLLHGITASGKTEVYFGAIEEVLKQDKQSIVFVPEIALTPQVLLWFTEKFGKDNVALIHSRLTNSEKFAQWQNIKSGKAKIIVGARSALFSPCKDLGLIVIDEEHEHTYKQEDVPKYHLIDAAIKRAQICRAVVILGSATPSLESMYKAQRKDFEFIELPERIKGKNLPQVQIVDMRNQRRINRRLPVISKTLEDAVIKCLKNKEQVILFLNRRGFSTFVHCAKCGYVVSCPRCNVGLVYHFSTKELLCHHCSYRGRAPELCPECNKDYIRFYGAGTEKVESELYRLFPAARIRRMDSDALKDKEGYFEIFDKFRSGEIDILVGTQMLAKGLDFPNVTLVGVVSADVTLNIPDFRSSERTFSLLTQVAGRAGRGKSLGKVIIQTHTPEHYAVKCALTHDYNTFYAQEMAFRKQLNLPPYTHIVNVVLRSKDESKVILASEEFTVLLRGSNREKEIDIVGASPMPVPKVRGFFRWGIILKGENVFKINELLKACFLSWKHSSKVKISVDVDPLMVT